MAYKLKTEEAAEVAGEILKWKLPMLMTDHKLVKIKRVASFALTLCHSMPKAPYCILLKNKKKPHIDVNDLVKINQFIKSKIKS